MRKILISVLVLAALVSCLGMNAFAEEVEDIVEITETEPVQSAPEATPVPEVATAAESATSETAVEPAPAEAPVEEPVDSDAAIARMVFRQALIGVAGLAIVSVVVLILLRKRQK